MFEDYELQQAVFSLDGMLATISLLSDKDRISIESPELPMQSVMFNTNIATLNKIPTLSNEGVKQSLAAGMDKVLEFIKKLYVNLIKFIKKISSRLFGKNAVNDIRENESAVKKYDLDLDNISKEATYRFKELISSPIRDINTMIVTKLNNPEHIEILKEIFPKDKVDDVLGYDYSDLDVLNEAQINFIFKTNYSKMESLIEQIIISVETKSYTVPTNIGILKLDKANMMYVNTDDTPNPKLRVVTDEMLSYTATLDEAADYLESDLHPRLSKAIMGIDSSEHTADNIHTMRKIYAIFNMIQFHTNTLVISYNRNKDLFIEIFKIAKYLEIVDKIKTEEQ